MFTLKLIEREDSDKDPYNDALNQIPLPVVFTRPT